VNGIGTQMHIDANTDRSKVAEMFRLLAATGKLIGVSELDMGLSGKRPPRQHQLIIMSRKIPINM